jgi:hypothetical protein
VEARQYHHGIPREREIQRIGKPAQNRSTNLSMDHRIHERRFRKTLEEVGHRGAELAPKAGGR